MQQNSGYFPNSNILLFQVLLNYKNLMTYFCCFFIPFGSFSDMSKMVKTIPVIITFLLWYSAKHIVDTQMNLNWYNNYYDGTKKKKPWGFNLSQILSWLYG